MNGKLEPGLQGCALASPATENVGADPDHSLAARLRAGDLLAFEHLVQKYEQPIVNFATRILRDMDEAQDVAQNVFVQAFRALANFQFASRLSTWLYAIARNLCLNELRRRSRHRLASLDHEQETRLKEQFEDTRTRSASELLFEAELTQKIEEALAALPEPQRKAILLWSEHQMSYQEIAEILQVSLPATKSLIHRGRITLKRKLRPYLRSGTWSGHRTRGTLPILALGGTGSASRC